VVATGFLDRLESQLKIGRGRRLPPSSSAGTGHRQKELRIRRIELAPVDCSIAINLFENLASATDEYFGATEKLANLVGQHGEFEKEKRHAEGTREKCRIARLALEQHWSEHGCR